MEGAEWQDDEHQGLGFHHTYLEEQAGRQAGWSSGCLRARCEGKCCSLLPGWPSDQLARGCSTEPAVAVGRWMLRRDDFDGFCAIIAEVMNGLEDRVSEHFARGPAISCGYLVLLNPIFSNPHRVFWPNSSCGPQRGSKKRHCGSEETSEYQ